MDERKVRLFGFLIRMGRIQINDAPAIYSERLASMTDDSLTPKEPTVAK